MSETTRKDWDAVFGMNIYEFFNIVAYSKDKAAFDKEQIDKWKMRN